MSQLPEPVKYQAGNGIVHWVAEKTAWGASEYAFRTICDRKAIAYRIGHREWAANSLPVTCLECCALFPEE